MLALAFAGYAGSQLTKRLCDRQTYAEEGFRHTDDSDERGNVVNQAEITVSLHHRQHIQVFRLRSHKVVMGIPSTQLSTKKRILAKIAK